MLIPSVTEIISPWTDFSRIPPAILENAGLRGTRVHELCAAIAKGEPVMDPNPETSGYVASFRVWFEAIVDEVILVEERLVDPGLGYSGQIDLLVRTKQGEIWLVDLKTPLALSKGWRLQLAGYFRLCDVAGYHPDKAGSLRLSPDGKMAKMDFYEESAIDLMRFMESLDLYRYFHS
jgi:hypothetical protein